LLEPESIDLIATDPPYPFEFIHCWETLSENAGRLLKPGHFLLAYSGQTHLNKVMAILSKNLTYLWTIALFHTGPPQAIHHRHVFCGWKPILLYSKGAPVFEMENYAKDVLTGTGREKAGHPWAQAEDEMVDLVKRFGKQDYTILDPFLGSGTTCVVAKRLGCKSVGIEIEKANCEIAVNRLENVETGLREAWVHKGLFGK